MRLTAMPRSLKIPIVLNSDKLGKIIKCTIAKEQLRAYCLNIHLTTIGGPWYFWKGICPSKAHKPVTLSGNPTFTKV